MNYLSKSVGWMSSVLSSPLPATSVKIFDVAEQVDAEKIGERIERDEHYFSLWVNQLYLDKGNLAWAEYDPTVLFVTDYMYAGERVTVPYVIGPAMIKNTPGPIPHGFLINDIKVAGPVPFKGGNIGITVILYAMKRTDFARELLKIVQGLSSAVGAPADIATLLKVGVSLIDGIEAAVGLGETRSIVGHRREINTSSRMGLRSFFSALSNDASFNDRSLQIKSGRLLLNEDGRAMPYSGSDFVLYSLVGSETRGDDQLLGLEKLRKSAMRDAAGKSDDEWQRAKSTMATLYQELVSSDDLTLAEANQLADTYIAKLKDAHRRSKIKMLSTGVQVRAADKALEKFKVITKM